MTSRLPLRTSPAASGSNTAAPDTAYRVRRRVTRHLIPYLMFVYLLAYLDRANLGVAKLQMQMDLNFTDAIIGLGAGVYFFGFVVISLPGSLVVERWSARKWIASIMIAWGVAATVMGFLGTPLLGALSTKAQFYLLRFLLGVAEAGFFPGVVVYFSHWFRMEDRALAFFVVTQPMAVATGIPMSRWVLDHIHWYGLVGWRWVFILEGAPPILFGFITLWYLADRPHTAK